MGRHEGFHSNMQVKFCCLYEEYNIIKNIKSKKGFY